MKQKLVDFIKSKYADNAIGIDLTELYNQCTIHEIKEIDLIIQNWIDENKSTFWKIANGKQRQVNKLCVLFHDMQVKEEEREK